MPTHNKPYTHVHHGHSATVNKALWLVLALLACGRTEPEETVRVLSAAGEFPSMNELTAPQGSALRAVNVVVDVPDEYTTHRGLERSANAGREWTSFGYYQGSIIAHSEVESVLAHLTGGVWTEYAGTWNAPPGERMSFQEANGALFFTTSNGVYRLDGPTATPTLSGLPQGLPGTGSLTGASGFLTEGYTVAYRHSWALNVEASEVERLVEGAPSPRLLVNNPTATAASRDVAVSWPIPEDLPTGAYNRTYRSDAVIETISPTDEVRQVYERAPTADELAAGVFTFTDNTPDAVKGAAAYYAANSGEGLAQSNYRPTLVHGLTQFNGSVFGITVDGIQRLVLTLLGADALGIGNGISFTRGVVTETYAAAAAESFPGQFQLFTSGTPAQNTASTVDSLVRAINSRSGGVLRAFALDTDGTQPGRFLIEARDVEQTEIGVEVFGGARAWTPAPRSEFGGLASRAGATVTINTGFNHGLIVGQEINVFASSDPTGFPTGLKTVASVAATTFTYTEAGLAGSASVNIETTDREVATDSGTALNAYMWTKQEEPDHWPLANLGTIGNGTDVLWWGQPLDRFLFLGSDSGLYRLHGNATEGFSLMDNGVWDSTTSFLGRRNVAALDGQAYAIAREGLVTWTEGEKPASADIPIQEEIRALVTAIPEAVAEYGFLFGDDTNHRLYVCLPQTAEDTTATVCHIYSTRTGAWTRLDSTFPGFESGFQIGMAPKEAAGKAYFLYGPDLADQGYVLSTRNTFTDADYQGPDEEGIPAKVTYLPLLAGEPGRFKQWTWTRVFTKAPTTKLTVCFSSEWLPAEECQLLPDIDPKYTGYEPVQDPVRGIAWRTIVDKFRQRAKGLTVSVGHNIPGEPLHLLGLEVKHRAYGGGQ